MKSFDRRFVKTEKAIQEAFITLLKSYSYSEIGLEELCDEADLNKSTFYLHYQSIDMLASALEDAFLFDLSKGLGDLSFTNDPSSFLKAIFLFAKSDKKRLSAIFKCYRYRFNEKIESFCRSYLPKNGKSKTETYLYRARIDSIVSLFRSVAKDGFRLSEGEFLEFCGRLLPEKGL